MHSLCLVVGPDPEAQLAPFADYLPVPPWKRFLDAEEIALMADHFALPASELAGLAARMPEWQALEGGVEDGRLFSWEENNPNAKFGAFTIGGRFGGYLVLKDPASPSGLGRLLGKAPRERVDSARKRDVRHEPILADPPVALLHDGTWRECPISADAAVLEEWRRSFPALFAEIPDDALLTVVDLHG